MERLFLQHRSLEEWRQLAETSHRERYLRLLDQARSYEDVLPPAEHPSDSITYIGMAVANLSLAYLLSEDERHLDTARSWIEAAVGYPHWGKERMPDHDLDAAWLLFGLGLGYDWLKAELPDDEYEALREKLLLQGRRLYSFAVESEGSWWSSAYWQNHNWICYTGLATAAYALESEHPETREWSVRAQANFRQVLTLMPEDGSDYEGPVYWRYGVIWLLIYADLLEQRSGVDLHDCSFLRNTFDFRLYLSGPNLVDTCTLGDCHDRRSAHSRAACYRFASLYGLGHARWLTEQFDATGEWEREGREGLVKPGLFSEAWLEFLWFDPDAPLSPLHDLPLARAFPDLGLISIRSSWQADGTVMTFKCGSPSGLKAWTIGHAIDRRHGWNTISAGHGHPDENGFTLMRGDDHLVVDEGYNASKATRHHSTAMVSGRGQYREDGYNAFRELGPLWGGRLEDWHTLGGLGYVRGEAGRAYEPMLELERFTREIIFWEGRLVLVRDRLAAKSPQRFEWLLQSDTTPLATAENEFLIEAGDSQMRVRVLEPDAHESRCSEEEIVANPTSAKPDWLIRRNQSSLVISLPDELHRARFTVALELGERQGRRLGLEDLPAARGRAWRATDGSESLLTAFSVEASGIEVAGVGSDSSWLVLERRAELPTRLLAGNLTQLWLDRDLLLTADRPVELTYDWRRSIAEVEATAGTWTSVLLPTPPIRIESGEAQEAPDHRYDESTGLLRVRLPAGRTTIAFGGTGHA